MSHVPPFSANACLSSFLNHTPNYTYPRMGGYSPPPILFLPCCCLDEGSIPTKGYWRAIVLATSDLLGKCCFPPIVRIDVSGTLGRPHGVLLPSESQQNRNASPVDSTPAFPHRNIRPVWGQTTTESPFAPKISSDVSPPNSISSRLYVIVV